MKEFHSILSSLIPHPSSLLLRGLVPWLATVAVYGPPLLFLIVLLLALTLTPGKEPEHGFRQD